MSVPTDERLRAYYDFSPETIDTVAELAERQAGYGSYQEFFDAAGVKELVPWRADDSCKPIEVLDIRPADHEDEAIFYHLPMANRLDTNQIYQIATVAASNPTRRIVAIGNPSNNLATGALKLRDCRKVAKGDFSPLAYPYIRYADYQDIKKASNVGYSLGADVAIETAARDAHEVPRSVLIEPASVKKRNIDELREAFASTAKMLESYVEVCELPTFKAAREVANAEFSNLGLLRATNIAIALGLRHGGFGHRLNLALYHQPNMRTTVAWGSASELADDEAVSQILERGHSIEIGSGKVVPVRLVDQTHASANDIHLQAALIAEGLREAA